MSSHDDERPTHGQVLRLVHGWCAAHRATLLGVGLERAGDAVYWSAEVLLDTGVRLTALGVTPAELTRSLDTGNRLSALN